MGGEGALGGTLEGKKGLEKSRNSKKGISWFPLGAVGDPLRAQEKKPKKKSAGGGKKRTYVVTDRRKNRQSGSAGAKKIPTKGGT